MKPVTHPLAIAYVEAIRDKCDPLPALMQWRDARFPLYADPTPMPAPALGMRVWIEAVAVTSGIAYTTSVDVREILPDSGPMRWDAVVRDPATIIIITDFRTGEVIWRRS